MCPQSCEFLLIQQREGEAQPALSFGALEHLSAMLLNRVKALGRIPHAARALRELRYHLHISRIRLSLTPEFMGHFLSPRKAFSAKMMGTEIARTQHVCPLMKRSTLSRDWGEGYLQL